MILYFSFNINEKDFSGLPTYSNMFLEYFEHKINIITINIIVQENGVFGINKINENLYNITLPEFFSVKYKELTDLIFKIIDNNPIKKVILPDYILQEYFDTIDLKSRNIEKILFIHLLYRGMLDKFTKEPYFERHLLSGMQYLSKTSFYEYKAIISSDTIICNSNYTRNQLLKYYDDCGLQNKNIHTLPLGINVEKIPFKPNLDSEKFAFFGRLDTQKGIWWIIKDIEDHKEMYRKNPLVVCGDGLHEIYFIKSYLYNKTVDYKGLLNKKELYKTLEDVKYCIFPSVYEPYGLALSEALAMGKICIIPAEDSGLKEQHKNNGDISNLILFDFRRDSIIKYIETLNKDKKSLEKYQIEMTKFSRKSVNTWNNHFNYLEDVLINDYTNKVDVQEKSIVVNVKKEQLKNNNITNEITKYVTNEITNRITENLDKNIDQFRVLTYINIRKEK